MKLEQLIKDMKAENVKRDAERSAPNVSKYNKRKLGHERRIVAETIARLEKIK
jgi:hypothetical protein